MTPEQRADLYIEVDDELAQLIATINAAPKASNELCFAEFQDVIIGSILGPFGLSAAMLADVDGGNITTLHNFEAGVVANAEDHKRYEGFQQAQTERFDRRPYSQDLPRERAEEFSNGKPIIDVYSGAELAKDRTTHRDHVVSAHTVHKSSKGHLAQDERERVATANLDENKAWTQQGLNCSKSDKDLRHWAGSPSAKDPSKTNAEMYGADSTRMNDAYDRARRAVNSKQDLALLKKQASEFVQEGSLEAGKLALRQILGLILADLAKGLSQDIRALMRQPVLDASQIASQLKARASATFEQLKQKWAHYLEHGLWAGLSGLLSSLVTFLINSLITTAKNVVTIIREGISAIVQAMKLMLMPEPGMSSADIASAVLKVLAGVAIVAVGITIEEGVRKAIELMAPFLAAFGDSIAAVVTGMATGIVGLLLILAFDQLKERVAFRNKAHADLHREQCVTLLQIKTTVLVIDEAASSMTSRDHVTRQRLAFNAAEIDELRTTTDEGLNAFTASVNALSLIKV